MSDANQVSIGLIKETTFDTIPTAPAFIQLRNTGQPGLAAAPLTIVSNELRSDRQTTDVIKVGKEAGGNINFEVSFGAIDELIEGAFMSAWTNKPTIVNTSADNEITQVTDSTDTYTVSGGAGAIGTVFVANMIARASGFTNSANNGNFIVSSSTSTTVVMGGTPTLTDEAAPPSGARLRAVGFRSVSNGDVQLTAGATNSIDSTSTDLSSFGITAGQWLKIGGTAAGNKSATAANNDWVRVSGTPTSTQIVLDVVPSGWTTDTTAAISLDIWFGDYIREGTTRNSYSMERIYNDHTSVLYEYFSGMVFESLSLSSPAQSALTGSVVLVGAANDSSAGFTTTQFASATAVAAPTNSILNTSTDVAGVYENGGELAAGIVGEFTCQIANSTRRINAVGSDGTADIGLGRVQMTIGLNTYFEDKTLAAKVNANTETAFAVPLEDTTNLNAYLIDCPRVKYASGAPDVPGIDQDVVLALQGTAFRHATLGYTAQFQRFHYVE